MIKQDVAVNVGGMKVELGKGDVAVLSNIDESGNPCLLFANLNKEHKAGEDFKLNEIVGYNEEKNAIESPLVISVENMAALNVLKLNIQQIENVLAEKETKETKEEQPKFTVKTNTLKVLSKFKDYSQSPDEIIACLTNYQKDGKLDREIIVNCNKQIKDGYVAYLVANYLGIKELEVTAPKGISGYFQTGTITFHTADVSLDIGYDEVTKKYIAFVNNVDIGRFDTINILARYLDVIFRGLFIPRFTYGTGNLNELLKAELQLLGY